MADAMDKVLKQALQDGTDSQKDLYLTFHLGGEDYGLDIGHVIEIVGIQKITEVPDMPNYLKGVVNMHGIVIPVMDVRTRFKLPGRDYDERTCIIVVEINETSMGLVVDEVREVAPVAVDSIRQIFPVAHRLDLWRLEPQAVLPSVAILMCLGITYLGLGHLWLGKQDI